MEQKIIEKLRKIKKEYEIANEQLQDSSSLSDVSKITLLNKQIKKYELRVLLLNRWDFLKSEIKDAEIMLASETDPELIQISKETINESKMELIKLEEKILKIMILMMKKM